MSRKTLEYVLPFPPSLNHYHRRVRRGRNVEVRISKRGRAFRSDVCAVVLTAGPPPKLANRLAVQLDLIPPDMRRRDLDNYAKATLDALEHAGVYLDDCQIDVLTIRRRPPFGAGRAVVRIFQSWSDDGTHIV